MGTSKGEELGDACVVESPQRRQNGKEGLRLAGEVQGVCSLVNIESFESRIDR